MAKFGEGKDPTLALPTLGREKDLTLALSIVTYTPQRRGDSVVLLCYHVGKELPELARLPTEHDCR